MRGAFGFKLSSQKYLCRRPLLTCDRREGSQFWRSIQEVNHDIGRGASFAVGNGKCTRFWLDSLLGGQPLHEEYSCLFAICVQPLLLVAFAADGDTQNESSYGALLSLYPKSCIHAAVVPACRHQDKERPDDMLRDLL
jgi:hypothetical protein